MHVQEQEKGKAHLNKYLSLSRHGPLDLADGHRRGWAGAVFDCYCAHCWFFAHDELWCLGGKEEEGRKKGGEGNAGKMKRKRETVYVRRRRGCGGDVIPAAR